MDREGATTAGVAAAHAVDDSAPARIIGVVGKSLAVAWFCFFLFSVLLLFLRKEADFVFPIFSAYSVVLVLATFGYAIASLYRQGVRHD